MTRMTIAAFLSKARQSLTQSLQSKGQKHASFVIGNESADLDSITCALVYSYIQSSTQEAKNADRCLIPVANVPSSELGLRPELTALLKHADLKPSELVTLDDLGEVWDIIPPDTTDWTLVDHNAFQGTLGKHYSERVVGVIDHHEDEHKVPQSASPRLISKSGSCTSHVTNYCHATWGTVSPQSHEATMSAGSDSTIDAQIAKLAVGSILIDTVNLKAEDKVTEHDRKAVEYLEAKIRISSTLGPGWNRDAFFREINDAKSNLDGLSLEDILRKDYKQWNENELSLGISSCVQPIQYLQSKDGDFVPGILDFAKQREIDLFAIMTAHNSSGTFERQLLLVAMNEGKAVDIAEKFADDHGKELQLEESKADVRGEEAVWLELWEQKDLAASRKKVAPLLRECMR